MAPYVKARGALARLFDKPTPSDLPLTDDKYNTTLDDACCPWGNKIVLTLGNLTCSVSNETNER